MSRTEFEEAAFSKGRRLIAGVDEAGRGPLAGPVVAAACILPKGYALAGIDDSKKLTPLQRKEIYDILTNDPDVIFGIGIVQSPLIDEINILKASLHAMALAIQDLSVEPDYLLIDGNFLPPTHIAAKAVIKGDSRSISIGAASIIAKQKRDLLMCEYHEKFPHYGFDKHKGYGTKMHIEALKKHGPCPIHRTSFAPVRSLTLPNCLDIPKQLQQLEFCQSERSRLNPIEAAPIQVDRCDAEGVKGGDAQEGKNQLLKLFGYKNESQTEKEQLDGA
ncbi:MAG: ribonuclease HII [Chlamydiia bacterium]|nr:ribonuclease HII [Chlamydiia bacterium]